MDKDVKAFKETVNQEFDDARLNAKWAIEDLLENMGKYKSAGIFKNDLLADKVKAIFETMHKALSKV